MISKTIRLLFFDKYLFFKFLLIVPSTFSLLAQTITPKKLPFDKICAGGPHPTISGQVFNEYQAAFSINDFINPAETFVVILSNPSGSFTTQTTTTTLPPLAGTPPDTATDKTITFAIPTDLIGSNTYELRVKSSSGIMSSSFTINGLTSVKKFPAYFKAYNESFFINNKKSTLSFCNGSSLVLTVDNPTPSIPNSSPANFPQLAYNWYKDGALIPGQTTSSLSVNSAGVYYAEINYGPCTDVNIRSQSVTVTGISESIVTIISSSGNPFCASLGNSTLTATPGNSYLWKKDNVVIPNEIGQTYQTNLPGIYTCEVDFGGCKATGAIDIKVDEFNSTINVNLDKVNNIEEGETLIVTTTTSAINPTYQWFFNNTLIPSATQSSLNITTAGLYKVVITQTSGCIITKELPFEVAYKVPLNAAKISNIVTPNGDGINDTWIIPDEYSDTNTQVLILNSSGKNVFQTNNYDNYMGWPQETIDFKNFNPVFYYIITPIGQSAKKGSITVFK